MARTKVAWVRKRGRRGWQVSSDQPSSQACGDDEGELQGRREEKGGMHQSDMIVAPAAI